METYTQLYNLLNKSLSELNDSFDKHPKELYDPQKYILSLGGKRIRPLLTLIGADLFNCDPGKAIHAAHAVELFHNFSLIHDDIMDNAPLRRGNATVHEKWNTNIAILSGDAMLVKAYQELNKCEACFLPQLLQLFNQTAIEVCEGQQLDMNFETLDEVAIEDYVRMIGLKTAVLLGCSLQMGSIIAGADDQSQQHIYNFGKEIGVAFQLKDDILDVYGNSEKVGKQTGGDIISNKKTFLLLKSLELANKEQRHELNFWLTKIDFDKNEKISSVKNIFDQLNIETISEKEMSKHYSSALANLRSIDCNHQKKNQLFSFAESLIEREF
ncbi:MAG: polyprenyl synthetase family protein [Bacteroidota bacterium]|nr:polyprenyl synthetase family protein [Bacteroidota bacterium]